MTRVWVGIATVATVVFLVALAPALLVLLALVLLGADVVALISGKRAADHGTGISKRGVSVVIGSVACHHGRRRLRWVDAAERREAALTMARLSKVSRDAAI